MASRIVIAAVIGFLVAVFWFLMAFVLFTWDASGPWGTVYAWALLITCPAWLAPLGPLMPLLNAAIYAVVALVASTIIRELKKDQKSLSR